MLLDEKKIEQKKFAEAIGTTDKVVSKWRTAGLKSYQKYLPQIADVLNTTVDFLVNGDTDLVSTFKDVPQQETIEELLNVSTDFASSMIQSMREFIYGSSTLPQRLDPTICRLFLQAKIYATGVPPTAKLVVLPDVDRQESKLLSLYRELNKEGQECLIETADTMVSSGKYKKSSKTVVGSEEKQVK